MSKNISLKEILRVEMGAISKLYPRLTLFKKSNCVVLEGFLDFTAVMPQYQAITDSYKVRIILSYNFPFTLPLVYELLGRTKSFHTNPVVETLCLGAPPKLFKLLSTNPSILYFIEQILIPFLYKASYSVKYRMIPGGDLVHGLEGIAQYYAEELNEDYDLILKFTQATDTGSIIKGHWICPCGSGKRVRDCHFILANKFNLFLKDTPKQIKAI